MKTIRRNAPLGATGGWNAAMTQEAITTEEVITTVEVITMKIDPALV